MRQTRHTSVRAPVALLGLLLLLPGGALAGDAETPQDEGSRAEVAATRRAPPQVEVSAGIEIWPPDGRHRTFHLSDCVARAQDAAGRPLDPDRAGHIVRAWSDEAEDAYFAGDGASLDDVVIVSASSFMVRAERQSGGNGRVYGVELELVDGEGNVGRAICRVSVPVDWGRPAVDDGPAAGYVVEPRGPALVAAPRTSRRR